MSAIPKDYTFKCPSCHKALARLQNNTLSIMGDATITQDFPPKSWANNWIKCTKHDKYAVICVDTLIKTVSSYAKK